MTLTGLILFRVDNPPEYMRVTSHAVSSNATDVCPFCYLNNNDAVRTLAFNLITLSLFVQMVYARVFIKALLNT